MLIAFYRISESIVRVYGMRAADVERFCLALQEAEPRLHCRGQFQDPLKLLYYAEVSFSDAPDLRAELPPVGAFYGHPDVRLLMQHAGVRRVAQLGGPPC
jgi:hypothetical protein